MTDADGSSWIIKLVPHPLGEMMGRLVLGTDSQSCPLVLSSSSHGGKLPDGLPPFPASLSTLLLVFPGTLLPNQLLAVFFAEGLLLREPKLTEQ